MQFIYQKFNTQKSLFIQTSIRRILLTRLGCVLFSQRNEHERHMKGKATLSRLAREQRTVVLMI